MRKFPLTQKQVLTWTLITKILDNLSTIYAVQKHSWAGELNMVIGLGQTPLQKHVLLWTTTLIALGFAKIMYERETLHTGLEWMLLTLTIVPLWNITYSKYIALLFIVTTFTILMRVIIIGYRKQGLKAWFSLTRTYKVKPMFFVFKEDASLLDRLPKKVKT